ncbi:TATA-binding protein-associated factor [Vigna unguiculata]|uniref:TATA-binding protein-associated factor n=1 Tax=Vigna unguiculata TaxID=3917 RepID=A0A4D6LVI9_VIGUN|nr:TATA-binding protein-associated factor [Vigna unguiculata]
MPHTLFTSIKVHVLDSAPSTHRRRGLRTRNYLDACVMNLLAEIYSQEDMAPNMYEVLRLGDKEMENGGGGSGDDDGEENPYVLSTLAQRLWPFMRHSITSVRYSAIRTLERLLEAGYKRSMSELSGASFWPSSIFGDTLRIVFQNLLLETNEDILQCSERVWSLFFSCQLPVGSLKFVIDPLWRSLTSFSGVQRQVASMVLISLFKEIKLKNSSKNLDGIPGALKGGTCYIILEGLRYRRV